MIASYIRKKDHLGSQDANMMAIGYPYDLSKRTTLYTSYGRIQNHNGGFYTVNASIETGPGSRSMDVGIRHSF